MVTTKMNADLSAALKCRTSSARNNNSRLANGWRSVRKKYLNMDFVRFLLFDVTALPIVAVLVIVAELILNVVVIWRIPYTEIDWIAYMQECEGFLNGTTNYALLKGDTGPLVYPGAFVYIYSVLYFITGHGKNIYLAQCIFVVVYLAQMCLVMRLYAKSRKVPPYVLAISAFTSYRVHSIYVLRLFNDPLAVLLLYAALNLFVDERWTWGSVCYSIGVGIKMNILLYAPALFLFYLVNLGYRRTIIQLLICAVIQLLVGAPFLLTHPYAYVRGAFNLGRIFEHKWTVNYRFLNRTIFEHTTFHLVLLIIHVLLLLLFTRPTLKYFTNYVRLRALQKQLQPQIERKNREMTTTAVAAAAAATTTTMKKKKTKKIPPDNEFTAGEQTFLKAFEKSLKQTQVRKNDNDDDADTTFATTTPAPKSIHFDQCIQLALLPFFLCNFIGIACARSLHYQFYVWYFHSLPHLAWSTGYSLGLRFLMLGLIELAWNTYPSTALSSGLLHACHLTLLAGVGYSVFKTHGMSERLQRDHQQQVQIEKERTE